MKKLLIILLAIFSLTQVNAQQIYIDNFILKQSLTAKDKLVVIATDSLDNALTNINGKYTFSVSGFTQELNFNEGLATLQLPIEKSTFVYLKHENEHGIHSKLAYVLKTGTELKPHIISRIYFIIVPVLILILVFAFKRLIYFAIFIFLAFLYFGHSKGLNIGTYFETIFDYLKSLVG